MKLHAPFAFDDLCDAPRRPELGREAERFGVLVQPANDFDFARRRQLGRSTRSGFGCQSLVAMLLEGIPPLANGGWVDAEKLRNFCGVVAFGDPLNG